MMRVEYSTMEVWRFKSNRIILFNHILVAFLDTPMEKKEKKGKRKKIARIQSSIIKWFTGYGLLLV